MLTAVRDEIAIIRAVFTTQSLAAYRSAAPFSNDLRCLGRFVRAIRLHAYAIHTGGAERMSDQTVVADTIRFGLQLNSFVNPNRHPGLLGHIVTAPLDQTRDQRLRQPPQY